MAIDFESGVLTTGQTVFVQVDPDDPLRIEPGVVSHEAIGLGAGQSLAPVDVTVDGRRCLFLRRHVHLSETRALCASLRGAATLFE